MSHALAVGRRLSTGGATGVRWRGDGCPLEVKGTLLAGLHTNWRRRTRCTETDMPRPGVGGNV
eukprot:353924-Chlamydomonas_euryale.AAC.1